MAARAEAPAGGPLYVFGVIVAGADVKPPADVQLIGDGELAALASPVPEDPAPGRELLEQHERVLSETIAATTVLPARFGMVMEDAAAVRTELLRRHGELLAERLRALDGHVQMSLKAFYVGDALLREVVAADPRIAGAAARVRGRPEAASRGERLWLGELVADAVAARRARDEQLLLDRLAPAVADLKSEPLRNERMALNAQMLVRRDAREALDAVVRDLTAAVDGWLALRYVGPLAPYSFAELELEAGEAAWA